MSKQRIFIRPRRSCDSCDRAYAEWRIPQKLLEKLPPKMRGMHLCHWCAKRIAGVTSIITMEQPGHVEGWMKFRKIRVRKRS